MCGIVGVVCLDKSKGANMIGCDTIQYMTEAIKHRGPDDEGYLFGSYERHEHCSMGGKDTPQKVLSSNYAFTPDRLISDPQSRKDEQNFNVALGSRRLSILDLSPAGHQPMCNEDKTVWVVHNGEIYNYQELRSELKVLGHRFVSNTDTEVIIHAYEAWGRDCLKRFNGMWAFAILDLRQKRIFCSRDRFGIKPFYYYLNTKWLIFASEIKAILRSKVFEIKPNDKIIYNYLFYKKHDKTEETFFHNIRQLRGGEYLDLNLRNNGSHKKCRYWDINPERHMSVRSESEYSEEFYRLFEDSVRLRLISKVPVGTCLSGGLDSSSVVCVINKLLKEGRIKIPGRENIQKTFSARYHNSTHDEGPFIDSVCRHTDIEAHHVYPEGDFDEFQRMVYYQEEPFATLSIFAQWNVFKLAHQAGVTVTLDGQGSDEMLAGYHTAFIPFFSSLIESSCWLRLMNELRSYGKLHGHSIGNAYRRAMNYMRAQEKIPSLFSQVLEKLTTSSENYRNRTDWISNTFTSAFRKPPRKNSGVFCDSNLFKDYLYVSSIKPGLHHLLHYDDRNSMAFSIESRLPFLDYRLVEFLFATPSDQKIRTGMTKYILREAMKGIIPEFIRNRLDKIGFSTPQDVWFRSTLKDGIRDIFNSASFRQRPYFNWKAMNQIFEEHCLGNHDYSHEIWRSLNLELWLRRFIDV